MKSVLLFTALLVTASANAARIKIFEVKASAARGGNLTAKYIINPDDSISIGVSLSRLTNPHKNIRTYKFYKMDVPELSLQGQSIILISSEGIVECGTLDESRILRRPVIKLTGNCRFEEVTRWNRSKRLQLLLVTK